MVITDACAGVGRATVQAFARRGARIGLLAPGHDGLEGARRDVEAAGGQALMLLTDFADASQVEAAAQAVEEQFVSVNDALRTCLSQYRETIAPTATSTGDRALRVDNFG
jgi:NAD(P)-dependent dehydrogenase (short-subunit alcohol dehydrogenase family)